MKKLFLGLALTAGFFGVSQAQNVNDITKKVLDACGKANNITYQFNSYERFANGKKVNADVFLKFQASPLKVYADAKKPTAAKLVYIPSVNPKVQVKKGLTLKLDLYSKMLMADQHHPLDNAGFGTFKRIIEHSIKEKGYTTSSPELGNFVKITGSTTYDNKACWTIEILDKDYKIVKYTVKAGENTVFDLERKHAVPAYRIKQLNDIGNGISAGQVLKVPSAYAKKTTIYVDKETFLPIYQKMEDDEGVYEIYEFKNVKLNVKFTDEDFQL